MRAVIALLLVTFSVQMKQITSIKTKSLLPKSCAKSSRNGRQILRYGREVFCEDRWTVIQKRFNGSVNFQLNWGKYRKGFGNLDGEFWLGLNKINRLTRHSQCRLHIDLWDFDGNHAFANYSYFFVDDESHKYRLHVAGYSGTAGDSLGYHNNKPFSTYDKKHHHYVGNCATFYGRGSGGWWFHECFYSSLNAVWGRSEGHGFNIIWYHWKGARKAMKATKMKIRCD